MDSIKKPLGIFLAVLFVLTAVLALILFNFDQRAFVIETYQQAFARSDFYNKLPAVLADSMIGLTADTSQSVVMHGMNRETLEGFLRIMLSQETLKAMGDETLISVFAFLNQQTDLIQISLVPLKASMASDAGVQAVYSLLNTQPDCTMEQMAQAAMNLLGSGEIQFCKPPAELMPMLTPIIQGQMQATAQIIPDQLILFMAMPGNDPRANLQTARMAMRFSPVLPLGFLLLMSIVTVRSFKSWLNWWGNPLFITGLLTALISLVGAPIFGTILRSVLSSRLPIAMLGSASELASAMFQALLSPILWQGLGIAFIGFGMTVAGYFIKSKPAG
jgi:hypothetical protein